MINIGVLFDPRHARRFSAHLTQHGISHQIRPTAEAFEVWIYHEDQVDQSRQHLARYRQNPDDEAFRTRARQGFDGPTARAPRRRRRRVWYKPLTWTLIALCSGVFLATLTPLERPIFDALFMAPLGAGAFSSALANGQLWRLITPIVLHFDEVHLLFNMVGLYILGGFIEEKESSVRLLVLVLVAGVLSNAGQFYLEGPYFGGMSGVVYGLFGYLWARAKYDPHSGYYVHPPFAAAMMICLALGFSGLLDAVFGPIANAAHLAGLLAGALWAVVMTHQRSSF
ncbi:MAG: rhomboid family intramembrane serine protease [Candidatus Competibacterales bacterium]